MFGEKEKKDKTQEVEAVDELGIPWKNRAMEYKRKLEEIRTKLQQSENPYKTMNREELLYEIAKKCDMPEIVEDLLSRPVGKDEQTFGVYIERTKMKEATGTAVKHDCYFVTDHKFVRIFIYDMKGEITCWYKIWPLNKFAGLEENNLWDTGGLIPKVMLTHLDLLKTLEVKVYFDIDDKDLRQISLTSKEENKKKEIRRFASDIMTAIYAVDKNSRKS